VAVLAWCSVPRKSSVNPAGYHSKSGLDSIQIEGDTRSSLDWLSNLFYALLKLQPEWLECE